MPEIDCKGFRPTSIFFEWSKHDYLWFLGDRKNFSDELFTNFLILIKFQFYYYLNYDFNIIGL